MRRKERKKRRGKRKEETKNVFRVSLWKVTKVSVKYETNMIYQLVSWDFKSFFYRFLSFVLIEVFGLPRFSPLNIFTPRFVSSISCQITVNFWSNGKVQYVTIVVKFEIIIFFSKCVSKGMDLYYFVKNIFSFFTNEERKLEKYKFLDWIFRSSSRIVSDFLL